MRIATVLVLLVLVAGCRNSSAPPKEPPPDCDVVPPDSIRWARHENPACARNGNIAFGDQGVICDYRGGLGFSFDRDLRGLWVLHASNGQLQRILPGPTAMFTWSPSGTHLLFVAGQLYVIEIATLSIQRLTTSGTYYNPSWSTDSLRIAFDDGADLWCMDINGDNRRKLDELAHSPSWSPNGARLTYYKYISASFPTSAIFVINSDGTQARRLSGAHDALQPAFSPDGSRIAYTAQDIPGGAPQIWVVNADGSHARQVTRYGGAHPSWEPDGRHIVVGYPVGGCGVKDTGVLWSVDVETGDATQLTTAWPQHPELCRGN